MKITFSEQITEKKRKQTADGKYAIIEVDSRNVKIIKKNSLKSISLLRPDNSHLTLLCVG